MRLDTQGDRLQALPGLAARAGQVGEAFILQVPLLAAHSGEFGALRPGRQNALVQTTLVPERQDMLRRGASHTRNRGAALSHIIIERLGA